MAHETIITPISIDHGFSHIKTVDEVFPTAIAEVDIPISNDNILQIGDAYYRAGGKRIDVLEDKTSTDSFRLLTYVAIAKYLERRGIKKATVYLAVGLPIGRLAKEKDAFKQYLSEPKEVKFRFSGKAYIVTIENVIVFPQCYGAVASRIPQMKSEEVVVDLGSWTIDTLRIVGQMPDETGCGSDPNGLIPCMKKIDEECMRLYNTKIGEHIIEEIMMTGHADIDDCYKEVIEKELKKYVTSVYRSLREMGINVKTTPITFVGGGAPLMKRYMGETGKNIHSVEDVKANATGYDLLLKSYLKSRGIAFRG